MKPSTLKVLERAIEEGVVYGLRQYYKHRDDYPKESEVASVAELIADRVMGEVYEWFEFDDAPGD